MSQAFIPLVGLNIGLFIDIPRPAARSVARSPALLPTHTLSSRNSFRKKSLSATIMLHQSPVVSDVLATVLSGGIALSLLRLFEETAKRGLFDQVSHTRSLIFLYFECVSSVHSILADKAYSPNCM